MLDQGSLLEMHDSVKKRVDVCSHSIAAVGADGNVIVVEQFLSYLFRVSDMQAKQLTITLLYAIKHMTRIEESIGLQFMRYIQYLQTYTELINCG